MSERYKPLPSYAQRLFDYYMSRADDTENRTEYMRRGLIPTNNLRLFIVDNPEPELAPGTGIPNPYDYRQKPFGHIIEALKTEQPELWERAKEVAARCVDIMNTYWKTLAKDRSNGTDDAQTVGLEVEAACWEKAEVYTEVMHFLGPRLEAENIDPVDVCV